MNNLAKVAADYKIDLRNVIDPVALAVRLVAVGVPVATAAALCSVNRTTLHRKINEIFSSAPSQ